MTISDLYETYESQLHRYALGLTNDSHQADDLVQESFIRAMGHLELLKLLKPYQRRAWLYRTLKNLFLDEQKAQKRQADLAVQLKQTDDTLSYAMKEVMSPSPFEFVPERYENIFHKRYVLGMTSQEIAEALDIPAATVRSRLHLGMKQLRAKKSKFH